MSAVVDAPAPAGMGAMRLARPLSIIGAEVGEGASDPGCKWGARALLEHGLIQALPRHAGAAWAGAVGCDHSAGFDRTALIGHFNADLAAAVLDTLDRGRLPVVIGGDHSCAVGTWSAMSHAHRQDGPLGLVWIDAHLDSHTPETSESGAVHGMPLAALLGHGARGLTQILNSDAKLRPENVVVIGARSHEPAEAALLERLGVRVMFMPEVAARGFAECVAEAHRTVTRRTAAWGISFDLDALDPIDAPGTGTPVERGIRLGAALDALHGLLHAPGFAAFEMTEYNPHRDVDGRTARAAIALLNGLLRQRTDA